MTVRENFRRILHGESVALPMVHFGYWNELLVRWAQEGHLTREEAQGWNDGNEICRCLSRRLGFDCDFQDLVSPDNDLRPPFERKVVATLPDGSLHTMETNGVTVLTIPGALSIPAEIDHLLKDRRSYEKHYRPRLQPSPERLPKNLDAWIAEANALTDRPLRLHLGSMLGSVRDWLGLVELSYMQVDAPELLHQIIDDHFALSYQNTKALLEAGLKPDMGHYWEDICFNHGPLVSPDFFREFLAGNYTKMAKLLKANGCDLVSVDCDGMIDELLPLWLECGINVMFPIEIGTWHPDFAQWRAKYGPQLRGVGGFCKFALTQDRAAVDREIERLKPWVALGGFIPCPDHRLPLETKWDLVCYYTDAMRKAFSNP